MLLRRVIEHVRAQNFVAVGLDFVIVVLGVFIGIQVANWNDMRRASAAEHDTLIRMQLESEQVVAFWQEEVRRWREQNTNRKILLEALDKGVMTTEYKQAVDDAFMRLSHYPHFNPPRSVYDELIGAGGLSLISDLDARIAISEYVAQVEFATGQLYQFRTNLPELYDAYKGRVFSVYAPEEKSLRRFEYDLAALSADRYFVSNIVDAVRNQLQFQTYRELALEDAIEMCVAVSHAVSRTCEPIEISRESVRRRDGVNQ